MTADLSKRHAAEAALQFIEADSIVGIGTGSTVNHLIEALARRGPRIDGAVASSEESARRLRQHDIDVVELNSVGPIDLYVDGADETDRHLRLVKGGGGALTREKIIAAAARQFVCIVDESKLVPVLGSFPLPVEVIPMGRSLVARRLVAFGGQPQWRESYVTDNGNHILDVHNLKITDPLRLESEINQIPGVVSVGLFAARPADTLLIGTASGVEKRTR